jgi:hypothetical protein
MKIMIQKIRTAFAIQNVSGLFKLMKYLQAMMAGMCFEYVYRVESDVWYLPLGIGILTTVTLFIDVFSNDR